MKPIAAIVAALDDTGLLVAPFSETFQVTGIAEDSRKVAAGTLFCAIEGTAVDGHDFLRDASDRGAAAALVTHRNDIALPQIMVSDSRHAAGVAAREFYDNPTDEMTLVGVTGTNGKTTTVAIIQHLLNSRGSASTIGTLGAIDGAGKHLTGYASLTTPGPVEFQAVLADLKSHGVTHVACEASSHGLDQRRLHSVSFDAAVYTNLTHEHLDYHHDLESYAAAKMELSQLVSSGGVEVLNADDPTWSAIPERSDIRRLHYGRASRAEVRATDEQPIDSGTSCTFCFGDAKHYVRLPLLGEYNVANALAAAAAVWGIGVEPALIVERLADAPQVPGRMERLWSGEFNVLRDYAHTPDGFERAIRTIRAITPGRLVVLFGCGGDRDRDKRSIMASITAGLADLVVITDDNPRTEDPQRILDDVESGLGHVERLRIPDREEGIHRAVSLLRSGDCLLLLGKGHETYQIYGTEKMPFDEPSIVRAAVGQSR
ncbi:MAG: UDP-N-acetylmuramoyl-L-alanyl-D-glutamate--2,6-diaminopimelate ligase [Gemmatimonadota bacterium]|nr:MAG: UDP-N-acetylmuramoyl-L-alanyl-D-glutamate--2,6-diaminopimelate ligase [Gemmatimonadota bacterium]